MGFQTYHEWGSWESCVKSEVLELGQSRVILWEEKGGRKGGRSWVDGIMRAGTQARWGCDVTRARLAWQGKGGVKRPPWLWGSGYASPGSQEVTQ